MEARGLLEENKAHGGLPDVYRVVIRAFVSRGFGTWIQSALAQTVYTRSIKPERE